MSDSRSPSPSLSTTSSIRPPMWISDNSVSSCQKCSKGFSLLRRRHHCRQCGRCLCADCSNKRWTFPPPLMRSRVCVDCYPVLVSEKKKLKKGLSVQLPTSGSNVNIYSAVGDNINDNNSSNNCINDSNIAVSSSPLLNHANSDLRKRILTKTASSLPSTSSLSLLSSTPVSEQSSFSNNVTENAEDNDMDSIFHRPKWVDDSHSESCFACSSQFYLLNRRHHCRRCGNLVCGKCSSKKTHVPAFGSDVKKRVCDNCYDILQGNQPRYLPVSTPMTTIDQSWEQIVVNEREKLSNWLYVFFPMSSIHKTGWGTLSLHIRKAIRLPGSDIDGYSDPYVVVALNNNQNCNFYTSGVRNSTLNPEWNETTRLEVVLPCSSINVRVFDKDTTLVSSDDLLGTVNIPLQHYKDGLVHDDWFDLVVPDVFASYHAQHHTAKINIRARFTYNKIGEFFSYFINDGNMSHASNDSGEAVHIDTLSTHLFFITDNFISPLCNQLNNIKLIINWEWPYLSILTIIIWIFICLYPEWFIVSPLVLLALFMIWQYVVRRVEVAQSQLSSTVAIVTKGNEIQYQGAVVNDNSVSEELKKDRENTRGMLSVIIDNVIPSSYYPLLRWLQSMLALTVHILSTTYDLFYWKHMFSSAILLLILSCLVALLYYIGMRYILFIAISLLFMMHTSPFLAIVYILHGIVSYFVQKGGNTGSGNNSGSNSDISNSSVRTIGNVKSKNDIDVMVAEAAVREAGKIAESKKRWEIMGK